MGPLTMELAALELIGPEKTIALLLETTQNILMTLLDGSQVSDRCPLGYLFLLVLIFKHFAAEFCSYF